MPGIFSRYKTIEQHNNANKLQEGLVITHLGKGLAVETQTGDVILCETRRHIGIATVGDRVLWESISRDSGRVVKIQDRDSLLSRPMRNSKTRPVAANLDQVMIVLAVEPKCDFLLIDQYLVVCENHAIDASLVCNKIDIKHANVTLESRLQAYAKLGYEIFSVSAKSNTGLDNLKAKLKNHTSMLAGQSGVGKSSLTNAILPDINIKTGTLSKSNQHGRHTTTTATLFHLDEGGHLIDSPGVSVFGLADLSEKQLANGFREFQTHIPRCKFNDCRHIDNKGCAVIAAVTCGEIDPGRYTRFKKLRGKIHFAHQ